MVRFLQNKDLILKRIIDIDQKKEEDIIIVNLDTGAKQVYAIHPFIERGDVKPLLDKLSQYDSCYIVSYNTQENFDVLNSDWDLFAGFKRGFGMVFVNPFSRTDKKWSVFPSTHAMLSEKSGLKQSLNVIFSNVDQITRKEIEKIISES